MNALSNQFVLCKLCCPQSLNRYSYVQNDPVNFVDPSGLDDDEVHRVYTRGAPWQGPDFSFFYEHLLMLFDGGSPQPLTAPESQNPSPPALPIPDTGNLQLPLPSGLCDDRLSALFGGVAASVFEPPGVSAYFGAT